MIFVQLLAPVNEYKTPTIEYIAHSLNKKNPGITNNTILKFNHLTIGIKKLFFFVC